MQQEEMRTSRVVALALLVGVFFVAQEALTELASGRPVRLLSDVEVVLRFWLVWALLTPLLLQALRRWPPDAKPMYVPIIAHVSVAVVLASVHSILTLSLYPIARGLFGAVSLREALRQRPSLVAFTWGVFTSVCFYAVALMAYAAVRFRTKGAALEAELTQSKLDILRSQLRPHFLFNTLNAISVFMTEDADKARQMLLHLSALLRRSLDEEAHEASLRQELAFVDDYLAIQRGRFGDQLLVRIDVDPAVLDARFPVFLLQPLFENAMEHGKADDNHMTIALSARRADDELCVTLEDAGPGVEA
ncbi:MAG TPA: histidine kinase, partial [Burkholderiales bacterium]|nr:histidine kinase [Burkholderiales bacterium]